MSKTFKIAVTGATGHLGRVLLPILLEKGHRLSCLYRKKVPDALINKAEWIKGDLGSAEKIEELVRDAEVLIHCASVISVGEANKEEVFQVNVEAIENLVEACSKGGTRLIYISSSTATEDPEIGKELKDDSPYRENRKFFYAWTKAQAEMIIRQAMLENRIRGFIFRPTALVGPPDHVPSRFGQVIWDMYRGRMKLLPDGGYNLLDIRDFSQALVNSIERGHNGAVYLCGGSYVGLKELAQMTNPRNQAFTMKIDLILKFLPVLNVIKKMFPALKELNRESLLTLKYAPRLVDSSRAARDLGFYCRPVRETVQDLISWKKLQKHPDENE